MYILINFIFYIIKNILFTIFKTYTQQNTDLSARLAACWHRGVCLRYDSGSWSFCRQRQWCVLSK